MEKKCKVNVFKRFVGFALAGVMAVSLCSCGGGGKTAKGEDPDKVPTDTYEINWYLRGTAQNDAASVEQAVNDYLKDKINATLKLTFLESGQYNQKMGNMIAAGEYFDIGFAASYSLDYSTNANLGAFVELDDYLDTYLKDIAKEIPDYMLDSARVNGKLYALPTYKEAATQFGWIYRKDIADKYGIDMSKYKTLEEFKPVAEMLKEKESSIQYPIDWDKSNDFTSNMYSNDWVSFSGSNAYMGVSYAEGQDDTKVNLSYDMPTDDMKQCVEARRDYYKSGLVKKDVATATDLSARFNNGYTFAYYTMLKPGKAEELQSKCSYPIAQAETTPVYQDRLPGQGSMAVISKTSKNPERCARFLNLLNTDPVLKNLLVYGVEGKHYNKTADGQVELIKDSGYDMSNSSWMLGNVFLDYTQKGSDPDKAEKLKKFNEEAIIRKANSFVFNTENVDFKITEINNALKGFGAIGALGSMDADYDAENAKMKEAAENAGVREVIEEAQKQYDEFLKTQK